QAIFRLGGIVLTERALGVVPGSLQAQSPTAIQLGALRFDALACGQAQLQAGRRQRRQKLLGRDALDLFARQTRTGGLAVVQRLASALVSQVRRIARLHPRAAAAAEHAAGEQRDVLALRRGLRTAAALARQTLEI